MSYKCTCIKWDFLIAAAHSTLCSALIRFVLCSTLRCSPLLLFSLSLSSFCFALLTLWLLCLASVCLCLCGAGDVAAAPMLLRLRHIVRSRS